MTKVFSIVFVVSILLVALSFSVINAHEVQLNYYIGQIDLPLSFVVIICIILGGLLGALAMTKSLLGLRMELAKQRRASRHNEKELSQLKSITPKESSL